MRFASLLPPTAEGGCAQLRYLVACGDAGLARGRSGAQVTERVRFRRRRRRARGVPSRHVPDTFRARLAIRANRPLLNPNTRHARRLRSCTSCPAGKPYNRSRLRFYIPPNRGWSPSRHPPEFFFQKSNVVAALSSVQVVVPYTPFPGHMRTGCSQTSDTGMMR